MDPKKLSICANYYVRAPLTRKDAWLRNADMYMFTFPHPSDLDPVCKHGPHVWQSLYALPALEEKKQEYRPRQRQHQREPQTALVVAVNVHATMLAGKHPS
ncbi:hypothetical protein VTJ49DRAFT_3794 [Mycothermus thermophilus]|uniref:Uncharacterized protein n=1 Tax=Humicola insolens TaxID=85995 RepID=A0ABR3V8M3_HUMIN